MPGSILQAIIILLMYSMAAQKSAALAAEASSNHLAATRLEKLEAIYERNMQEHNEINSKQAKVIAEQAAFMENQAVMNTNEAEINFKQADQLEKQAEIIAELTDRMAGQELDNQKQTKFTAEQTEMIRDLGLENQKLVRVIAEQSERICDLELEQNQQDNIVAFTASASETRVYHQGDRVLFDSVLTNYGDSYDSLTSIFTCIVSGYYLFLVTVMTDGDGAMHAQIQLDDTPLVAAFSSDWKTGSNLVVIDCVEGQTVWVMCFSGQGEVMHEGGSRYSTFSGTLLTLR